MAPRPASPSSPSRSGIPLFKHHKYHATKTVVDGTTFSSRAEASRYSTLKAKVASGDISQLVLQPRFVLQVGFGPAGKKVRAIEYVADFQYMEAGRVIVEDVKGMKTETYNMKKKMFIFKYGKDHILREVKNGKAIDIYPIYTGSKA